MTEQPKHSLYFPYPGVEGRQVSAEAGLRGPEPGPVCRRWACHPQVPAGGLRHQAQAHQLQCQGHRGAVTRVGRPCL